MAIYSSSTTTTTGCVKQFATTEREDLMFPTQVPHECVLCKVTHNFRMNRVVSMSTPKQRKNVRDWCESQGMDLDIEIDIKAPG